MPPRLSPPARALLRSQGQVIATWQGPQVGVSSRSMRRAGRQGAWTPITSRTFLAQDAEPTQPQLRVAGTLELGRTALLAGSSALLEAGWSGDPGPWVDVVVPRNVVSSRRSLPTWLRIHRRANPQDASGLVPRVAPAESVLDAAAWARTDREAMFIVISALQQGIARPIGLDRALAARPNLRRARAVADLVAEFRSGVTTLGEVDLRAGCRARGLPEPTRQQPRRDGDGRVRYIDAEFTAADGVPVLVEVDGSGHMTPQGWLSDIRRQRRLHLPATARLLRVTNWELRHEPDEFFADLAVALRLAELSA